MRRTKLSKLLTLVAVLFSCVMSGAQAMGMSKKHWNPKDFFDGQQLVIAEGVSRNDLTALRATNDLELLSRVGKKELSLFSPF